MARTASKNLELKVTISYDVSNWMALPEMVQEAYNFLLQTWGDEVLKEVDNMLDPQGAKQAPELVFPHRTDTGFTYEDTGKLAKATNFRITRAGYRQTGTIVVNPILIRNRIVDYGTFLEVGWNVVIPTGGGMKFTGRFYRYPWISTAIARANTKVNQIVKKAWNTSQSAFFPQYIRVTGQIRDMKGRTRRGMPYSFSEDIKDEIFRAGSGRKPQVGDWLMRIDQYAERNLRSKRGEAPFVVFSDRRR